MSKIKTKRIILLALSIMVIACMMPASIMAKTSYTSTKSGGHAILVSGTSKSYTGIKVKKTGSSNSQNADFNGTNAAVLVTNKGTLKIKKSTIYTNGSHANGIFAYGSGSKAYIYNTKITTRGNCSGGIMTTGGATMTAVNLKVLTYGNSSAAIRSDRGGGTVNVTGGSYTTKGVGSPAIYSTAKIKVSGATLKSTKSEAVVIEGANSVYLKNCTVTGSNIKKNGQAKYYNNVLIYQSMSGDASVGSSRFTMYGGTMTSKKGAMFHVTNTTTVITLNHAKLNLSGNLLLTESADNWGTSGSNGGKVTFNAVNQTLKGTITVGSTSTLNLNLKSGSTYKGKINTSGQSGTVNVSVAKGTTWTLTGNTYVTSLTNNGTINTNGYTLYVNGTAYSK
jgi:hypothetical protein